MARRWHRPGAARTHAAAGRAAGRSAVLLHLLQSIQWAGVRTGRIRAGVRAAVRRVCGGRRATGAAGLAAHGGGAVRQADGVLKWNALNVIS